MPKKAKPKDEPEVVKAKLVKGEVDEEKLPYGLRVQHEARKVGAPAYQPTDWMRHMVEAMVFTGYPQQKIADHFGLSLPTIRKYYAHELDHGAEGFLARIGATLGMKALAGDTTAAIFILKTRAGWREQPTQLEIDSKGGPTAEDKKALVAQVMQMLERRAAPEPVDITPPKVIEHD